MRQGMRPQKHGPAIPKKRPVHIQKARPTSEALNRCKSLDLGERARFFRNSPLSEESLNRAVGLCKRAYPRKQQGDEREQDDPRQLFPPVEPELMISGTALRLRVKMLEKM